MLGGRVVIIKTVANPHDEPLSHPTLLFQEDAGDGSCVGGDD
jgi:hypothetical protein